ncbi:hypothetical protein [Pseudomonas sp. WS 5412]|uniref:hypothetical protein n=1 Tax=Pseudomonas sp. WS 5412 TaxID=2717487 RepID=UPI0031FF2D53
MAMEHDKSDQTEGAYSRSDFLGKRRALVADWSKFTKTAKSLQVLSLSLSYPPTTRVQKQQHITRHHNAS